MMHRYEFRRERKPNLLIEHDDKTDVFTFTGERRGRFFRVSLTASELLGVLCFGKSVASKGRKR